MATSPVDVDNRYFSVILVTVTRRPPLAIPCCSTKSVRLLPPLAKAWIDIFIAQVIFICIILTTKHFVYCKIVLFEISLTAFFADKLFPCDLALFLSPVALVVPPCVFFIFPGSSLSHIPIDTIANKDYGE